MTRGEVRKLNRTLKAEGKKYCTGCEQTKLLEEFYRKKADYAVQCRVCNASYARSEKARLTACKYRQTGKARLNHNRYRLSEKGQAAIKDYRGTPRYREVMRKAKAKYNASEHGRAVNLAYERKYKGVRTKLSQTNPARYARKLEQMREWSRRAWERTGRGVYMARIQDWRDYFDGLPSDVERCVAAHVLLSLASIDQVAKHIVRNHSFDFNYLAQHFDIA